MAKRLGFEDIAGPRAAKLDQIPDVALSDGEAEVAEQFAIASFGLSNDLNNILANATQAEAARQGAIAGQSPTFRPRTDATVAGRAYNRAGINAYLSTLEVNARTRLDELSREHRGDPDGLKKAAEAYQSGTLQSLSEVAAESVPAAQAFFQRALSPYLESALRDAQAAQRDETLAVAVQALESSQNGAERLSRVLEDDGDAAAALAAERAQFVKKLAEQGPPEAFSFEGLDMPLDPARSGAMDPVDMARFLAEFDDAVHTARVMGKFSRAGNKEQFLAEFMDKELNDQSSPLTVAQVETLATKMRTQISRDRTEIRARRTALKSEVDDAVFVLEHGGAPNGLNALILASREFPELRAELEGAMMDRDFAAGFAQLNPAAQQTHLNRIAALGPPPTRRAVELAERLQKVHARTVAQLDADPVSLGADLQLYELGGLDLADPQTIQGREHVATVLADTYGVQSDGFTTDERDALERQIRGMDSESKIGLMQVMNQTMSQARMQVFMGEVAKKQPAFAVAAGLSLDAPTVARDIIRGEQVLATAESKAFLPTPTDYLPQVQEVVGEALSQDGQVYNQVVTAALALDTQRRLSAGMLTRDDFDPDAFRQAVIDITGGTNELNSAAFLAPLRGLTQDEFDDLLARLTDDDLGPLVPFAGEFPVTADMIREQAELKSIGDGLYLVRINDGFAMDGGDAWEFDLRAAFQRVMARPAPPAKPVDVPAGALGVFGF